MPPGSPPAWLREFFALMSATYGALWNEKFLDETAFAALKLIWYFQLKDFEPDLIKLAMVQIIKTHQFPPTPADLVGILKNMQQREKDRVNFAQMDEKRLLPPPPKCLPTKETLETQLRMWEKLGNWKKIEQTKKAISELYGESEFQNDMPC